MNALKELPKYRSHKEVWALKIAKLEPVCAVASGSEAEADDSPGAVQPDQNVRVAGPDEETDGRLLMTPTDGDYLPIVLDAEYVQKHKPKRGGYYVVYHDGYKSWSPAEAFENGYTLIEPNKESI